MKTHFSDFRSAQFSFAEDPVLILEHFWSAEERKMFREAMDHSTWTALNNMPPVAQAFQNCGNWLKAEIAPAEGTRFMERVGLPCVAEYIESFPNITGRHINFNYYSYGVGDCLSTHDDTDNAYTHRSQASSPQVPGLFRRRIHHASDSWASDSCASNSHVADRSTPYSFRILRATTDLCTSSGPS